MTSVIESAIFLSTGVFPYDSVYGMFEGSMGSVKRDGFHRREVAHVRLFCSRTETSPSSWGRFHYGVTKDGIQQNVPLEEPGFSADRAGFDEGSIDILLVGTHQFGFKQIRNLIQLLRSICLQYTIPFNDVLPEYGSECGFDRDDLSVEDIRTMIRRE